MAVTMIVSRTGALFNNQWKPILIEGIRHAQQDVADYGVAEVVYALDDVLIENHGGYISTISSEWESNDLSIIDGTEYGPWLEGLGSRNETSRFKGYWTFRLTTSKIQDEAEAIALEAIVPFIEQINIY